MYMYIRSYENDSMYLYENSSASASEAMYVHDLITAAIGPSRSVVARYIHVDSAGYTEKLETNPGQY